MRIPIVVPVVGHGIDTVTIVKWCKGIGDQVARGDTLLEVESEKAVIEVPALDSGVLIGITNGDEALVGVGDTIGYLEGA
jgi:pyruvate/2-oxoglutarate dehydrogenase complex dihydrolipoamide acyltransferase (E2) component